MNESSNRIHNTTSISNTAVTLPDDSHLVDAADAAQIMGIHYITLCRYRREGTGPRYLKRQNRRILYHLADIEAWLAEHTFG